MDKSELDFLENEKSSSNAEDSLKREISDFQNQVISF